MLLMSQISFGEWIYSLILSVSLMQTDIVHSESLWEASEWKQWILGPEIFQIICFTKDCCLCFQENALFYGWDILDGYIERLQEFNCSSQSFQSFIWESLKVLWWILQHQFVWEYSGSLILHGLRQVGKLHRTANFIFSLFPMLFDLTFQTLC